MGEKPVRIVMSKRNSSPGVRFYRSISFKTPHRSDLKPTFYSPGGFQTKGLYYERAYYNVQQPEYGPDWQLQFQLQLMFPK